MTAIITLLLVAIVVSVGLFYPSWQRKQILRKPFPESWLDIVTRRLPFFDKLNPAEQMAERIKTLETILDAENPDWRDSHAT